MTTNRLIAAHRRPTGETLSLEALVERWNSQLTRDDIAWVIGKDGKPRLEHLETDFDRTMKRIKDGLVSQQAIDRLPFNIRRIAWNRGYLNCDYGEPPRYWLPKKPVEDAPQERTGLEWFNE